MMCTLSTVTLVAIWITLIGTLVVTMYYLHKDSKMLAKYLKEYYEKSEADGRDKARRKNVGTLCSDRGGKSLFEEKYGKKK